MAKKLGKKTTETVQTKRGKLRPGGSESRVMSRTQSIAIGSSQVRRTARKA